MQNETTAVGNPEASSDWKQIFEAAVIELGQDGVPDRKLKANAPIVPRNRIARLPLDPVAAQKRALTDAAQALAALWKKSDGKPVARKSYDPSKK